jgi:hypothetical protein
MIPDRSLCRGCTPVVTAVVWKTYPYERVSEWGGLDSNQRPADYESAALTN